jgi:hypothetical protein
VPNGVNTIFLASITIQELRHSVNQVARKGFPRVNGFTMELYRTYWSLIKSDLLEIYNRILQANHIPAPFLEGVICCVPKTKTRSTHTTLLNADYKILARIIAKRLKTIFSTVIHPSQHCGGIERTIIRAISGVRDVLETIELTKQKACLVSLDFSSAFDRISHTYLFSNLFYTN